MLDWAGPRSPTCFVDDEEIFYIQFAMRLAKLKADSNKFEGKVAGPWRVAAILKRSWESTKSPFVSTRGHNWRLQTFGSAPNHTWKIRDYDFLEFLARVADRVLTRVRHVLFGQSNSLD